MKVDMFQNTTERDLTFLLSTQATLKWFVYCRECKRKINDIMKKNIFHLTCKWCRIIPIHGG